MNEEIPLTNWTPLIDLCAKIHSKDKVDYKTAKAFYEKLGVLKMVGHTPMVFQSEVFIALKKK